MLSVAVAAGGATSRTVALERLAARCVRASTTRTDRHKCPSWAGVPVRQGQGSRARRGQVRELPRPALRTRDYVPEEEGGEAGRQGMEVAVSAAASWEG